MFVNSVGRLGTVAHAHFCSRAAPPPGGKKKEKSEHKPQEPRDHPCCVIDGTAGTFWVQFGQGCGSGKKHMVNFRLALANLNTLISGRKGLILLALTKYIYSSFVLKYLMFSMQLCCSSKGCTAPLLHYIYGTALVTLQTP